MLRAYSYRDLQMFAQMLATAAVERKSIGQLQADVAAALAGRAAHVQPSPSVPSGTNPIGQCPTVRVDGSACPGQMTRCPAIDGLIIMRCHACGYSEVE